MAAPISANNSMPPYVWLNVHPENDIYEAFDKLHKSFILSKFAFSQLKHNVDYEKCTFFLEDKESSPNLNTAEKIRYLSFNQFFYEKAREILAPYLPPESRGYFKAVKYVQYKLLTKPLWEMSTHEFLFEMQKINDLINAKNTVKRKDYGYRSDPLVVYDITVIPKERNAGSFKQLDKYVQEKATPDEFEIWKSTRAKVFKREFSKKEKKLRTI